MKCHYEILNIAKDAADDDIKKSYRKLALKFHPDKNPEDIEECTRQFHLIQQAYDVLIDPQERAWYDKHREAILKGGLGKGGDYDDESLDVYQYFNTSCFTGYGDDKEGFYAVYAEVFKTIAAEDLEFLDDEDSDFEIPVFGDSQSSHEEVVGPFYAHWESYCTAKSYVWAEKYDTREAPNRQIRRLMEQDNKKLRDKAKKERNEEVRALVAFVRKRDKRVQAYKKILEERALEIARRAEERKKKDRQKRLEALGDYEETEWSAMSGLEKDLKQLESNYAQQFGEGAENLDDAEVDSNSEQEGEDDYLDDLYCVACNKDFKTERAMENHEKSKKHKENLAFLKAQMEAEETEALQEKNDDIQELSSHEESLDTVKKDNLHEDLEELDLSDDDLDLDSDDDLNNKQKSKLSKKQKKKKKQKQMLHDLTHGIGDDDFTLESNAQSKSTEKPELKTSEPILTHESASELCADKKLEPSGESVVNKVVAETPGEKIIKQDVSEIESPETNAEISVSPDGLKDGENEIVTPDCGDRDPETADLGQPTTEPEVKDHEISAGKTPVKKSKPQPKKEFCNKCGRGFPTRNKLFDHIKQTGHALHVEAISEITPSLDTGANSKAKKKKKGKR